MWVVINYGQEKKLALEISGDETVNDIKRILQYVYHFPKNITMLYHDENITGLPGPLLQINSIESRPDEEKDLIELKISKGAFNDSQNKGPEGPVCQDIDISVGRYFKRDDKLSPSSINQSLSSSRKSNQVKLSAPNLKK